MKSKYLLIDVEKLQNFINFLLYPIRLIFILQYKIFRKPFSTGYNFYKWKIIKETLNKKKISYFSNTRGLDERVVENNWLIDELKKYRGKLLDAGSTINFPIILKQLLKNFSITIQTLYPENNNDLKNGVSYVYENLIEKNFHKNYFDVITCISTLEHVGFDNEIYKTLQINKKTRKNNQVYLNVIKNFKYYLKKNGILLITLPFGKYQKFNDLQQFDKKMINNIIKVFRPSKVEKKFAIYKNLQWQFCEEKDCLNIKFRNKKQKIANDEAASARSLILLKMRK